MASGRIKMHKSDGYFSRFNIIGALNNSDNASVFSFDLSDRGAGIMLVQRNALDASIYAITTAHDGTCTATKLAGATISSLDTSDSTNVHYTDYNWGSATILTSSNNWKLN